MGVIETSHNLATNEINPLSYVRENQPNRNQVPVEPSEEANAIYAYMNWEAEGRPDGRDISHWEQAEEQLLARYAHDRLVPFTHVQRSKR
jgi:hypothetical protein